jgi:hypothetical protein
VPKAPWAELSHAPQQVHLLVAELHASFFGGRVDSDPFDSHRLREGVNLMSRVCTRLRLMGRHAASASRAQDATLVLCLFDRHEDRDAVAELAAARPADEVGPWASRRDFSLSAAAHDRLVSVGGETDHRYAGRRQRERDREAARQSLRWGDF